MNGITSSLTRNRGEKAFPGTTHVAYFPNADHKNQVWFVSYLHHENLQMNKPIFIS